MNTFEDINFSDEQGVDEEVSKDFEESISKPRECPFTIIRDSNEQLPYLFQSIVGDSRDEYAPLIVKTVRKKLPVADYSIVGLPGIAIERKSKADLFSSMGDKAKRENFIERLRKMQTTLKYGAIVIECYPEEMYIDPPIHTKLNPKTVYRSTISWAHTISSYTLVLVQRSSMGRTSDISDSGEILRS